MLQLTQSVVVTRRKVKQLWLTQKLYRYRINKQGIKTVVITVFHVFQKLEKRLNVLSRNMEYLKVSDQISRDENDNVENEKQTTNGRLDIVEENINKLEEKTIATIHNESQGEKKLKKKREQSISDTREIL